MNFIKAIFANLCNIIKDTEVSMPVNIKLIISNVSQI